MDHFLEKQTVQNILGLRFANRIFESLWNSQHIEKVEIIWDESLTVEGRAAFGSDEVALVGEAAAAGRVATLLIEADRHVAGRIDPASGRIEYGDLAHPEVDDLLDDLGELVLNKGGRIVIVPTERMPARTGVAALYRF